MHMNVFKVKMAGQRYGCGEKKSGKEKKEFPATHWEGLFPACTDYGRSDNGYVEVAGLLLHQVLCQGFSVGVGVWVLPDQLGSQSGNQLLIHPSVKARTKLKYVQFNICSFSPDKPFNQHVFFLLVCFQHRVILHALISPTLGV